MTKYLPVTGAGLSMSWLGAQLGKLAVTLRPLTGAGINETIPLFGWGEIVQIGKGLKKALRWL